MKLTDSSSSSLQDDLIVRLLANKENYKKITLELADTKLYELDEIDIAMIERERWN